jgi:S1-C subfamily serine protease
MIHWATTLAATAGLLLGATGVARAQDDFEAQKRRIRDEVQRELAPEFQKRAAELKDRFEREARTLQEEFRKLVDAAVDRKLAELRGGAPTPAPAPVPAPPTPAPAGGAWVGVRVAETNDGWRVLLNLGDKGGLVVQHVEAGSPAEQAKLQLNDVITHFDGTRVGTRDELRAAVARCTAGQVVTVELIREGRKERIPLTLGGGPAAPGPRETPAPPAPVAPQSPRERIHALLRGLRDDLRQRVQGQLDGAASPEERQELMRMVAQKLLERLQGATDADQAELMRALQLGLAKYLAGAREAVRETAKDRAAALEELLERALHGEGAAAPGGKKRDVGKLLDDILGEAGKRKPGDGAKRPTPPDMPAVDPEKLKAEIERLRAKIEAEGFPQDEAGVRELVDTLLQRMNTNRQQVRQLIEMMGGPDGAKQLVKGQLQMQGIPLTDADLDRVMQALTGDEAGAKPRVPARKIGCSLDFTADGATVTAVADGSPAAKAGVAVGDVLVRVGDAVASNRDAVKAELSRRFAGDVVVLKLRRGGNDLTLKITMEAEPK